MASLIVGAGFLITEKIRNKKEAKKEAKRQRYEERYKELEEEHKKTQRKSTGGLERVQTGRSQDTEATTSKSPTSDNFSDDEDGPSRWVNEVNLARTRSGTSR